MNSSNVDFYIAGFDADGKRVGSIICDFNLEKNPKKLKEALAEAKEKFPEAVVVEPIGADAFNQYLDGYIRGTDGKPVEYIAPETAEEKKAAEAAKIAAKYEPQLAELKSNMITAVLLDDKELQTEIKEEYTQTMTDYNKELEVL